MAELTAEELKVARKLGLTPEQYAAGQPASVDAEAEIAHITEGIAGACIPDWQKAALLQGMTKTLEATK